MADANKVPAGSDVPLWCHTAAIRPAIYEIDMRTRSGKSSFETEIVLGDEYVMVTVSFSWRGCCGDDPEVEIHRVGRLDTGDELLFPTLPQSAQEHVEDQAREAAIDAIFEAAG